jgi:peroxiredoxin family protein
VCFEDYYGSENEIKRYHGWNDIQISKVKDVQHMEDKVKKQRTQKKTKQKNNNIATESKHYLVKIVQCRISTKLGRNFDYN